MVTSEHGGVVAFQLFPKARGLEGTKSVFYHISASTHARILTNLEKNKTKVADLLSHLFVNHFSRWSRSSRRGRILGSAKNPNPDQLDVLVSC